MRIIQAILFYAFVNLVFSPVGLTQDITPTPIPIEQDESAEIAAEEAAQRQAMQADWTTSAARAGRVRTFRAKVIDQDGKPVSGMKIGFSSLTQRDDFFSSGIAWNSADGEVSTDKQGIATFTPAPFRKLEASPRLREPEFSRLFRVPYQRTPMPLTRYYENTDSAPRPPDKAGFNMVFEVYRYRGPEKIGELMRSMDIPNDGVERALSVLSDRSDDKEVVPAAEERVGPYDFILTVKRPDVPYWEVAPAENNQREPLEAMPPYTCTLRCLNGGIQPISEAQAIEAPVNGYVREIRWTIPSPPKHTAVEAYNQLVPLFWKRGTTPTSYGRVRVKINWKEMRSAPETPKPIYAAVKMNIVLNLQGGRLFERAEIADRENEPWNVDLTPEIIAALGSQPIDPAQLPPADSKQMIGP